MMILSEKSADELVEYLEPQSLGVSSGLTGYYEYSESLSARATAVRKVLKGHSSLQFLEKPREECGSIITLLQRGRALTAKRVLGDYIGNHMIGVKKPTPFKILLCGQLRAITLKERKAAEKGWGKVLNDCFSLLDKLDAEIEDLELLAERLKLPRAKGQLAKYAFFLKEICCPKDLTTACEAVIEGDPIVVPTIPRPEPD